MRHYGHLATLILYKAFDVLPMLLSINDGALAALLATLSLVHVLQLPQDFSENAAPVQTELCPEELDEGVTEELESLHDTVLDKYTDEVA